MIRRSLKCFTQLFVLWVFVMGMPVLADQGKININTANEKQLCTLNRIGPKYAARIIKYREEVGEFKTPEDITKVRGIGNKTLEVNRGMIIVQDEIAEDGKKE